MRFNRVELLEALDVAKMAVDTRDFIPILSHFCFDSKNVTAYNDFIGIKVAMRTNFRLALQANTLMRLLSSVSNDEVDIKGAKGAVFLKAGAPRTGVRARLPFMGEEDFFFKFPTMKGLTPSKFTDAEAERFFTGIRLCLTSVGDQMPHQMGITLNEKKRLYMYSTNNKAISKYHMAPLKIAGAENIILPSMFCQAILKGASVYGTEDCRFTVGKDFAVMQFGDDCSIYGKLVNNKDPLDFEKVIAQHTPNWKEQKQKVPEKFHEIFERALLMLGNELHKVVIVSVDQQTMTVEAKSSLGKVKSSATFPKKFKTDEAVVDADLANKASGMCSEVFLGKGAIVFSRPNYMHLVSTQQG